MPKSRSSPRAVVIDIATAKRRRRSDSERARWWRRRRERVHLDGLLAFLHSLQRDEGTYSAQMRAILAEFYAHEVAEERQRLGEAGSTKYDKRA